MFEFIFSQYKDYEFIDMILEITAVIFGISSVLLAKKNNIWVYPTGLVSTTIYTYILLKYTLLGDMLINIYYTIMSIYGWILWAKKKENNIELNANFNFISWNYDLQLEETFKLFLGDKYDKNFESINKILKFKSTNEINNIFHLNGYRGFYSHKTNVDIEIKNSNDFEAYWQSIDFLYSDTNRGNINFNNHIKYAWEHKFEDKFLQNVAEVMKRTEVLIIIGYSFPAFNRQIDQYLFSYLHPNKVKKIIYQDPNGTSELIENLFSSPAYFESKIEILNNFKDLNQFYIPTEFFNTNWGKKDVYI